MIFVWWVASPTRKTTTIEAEIKQISRRDIVSRIKNFFKPIWFNGDNKNKISISSFKFLLNKIVRFFFMVAVAIIRGILEKAYIYDFLRLILIRSSDMFTWKVKFKLLKICGILFAKAWCPNLVVDAL